MIFCSEIVCKMVFASIRFAALCILDLDNLACPNPVKHVLSEAKAIAI